MTTHRRNRSFLLFALCLSLGSLLTDCARHPLSPDVEAAKGPRPSTRAVPDDVDYLLPLENSIVREYNLARTDPRRYAFFVSRVRPYFEGNVMKRPGYNAVITVEGVQAVDEAVRFLRKERPLAPLTPSFGLSRAALKHVEDQGPKGIVGHGGSDRSLPEQRIGMFGRPRGRIGENIAYGPHAAREVVMGLIIDDGVEGRGHRTNIFNAVFRRIGVSCGYHSTFQIMCVMTLAEAFEDDPKLESDRERNP
jgi:hypothetical protein